MKKSVKYAVLSALMVCCMVFSLPLTAFAAESYQMNINEPSKGDNQGYILLLVQGPSGTKQVQCISWTLLPVYTDDVGYYNATEMLIDISNSSSTITFIGRTSGAFQVSCGFGRSLNGDSARTTYWSRYDNNTALTYEYTLGSNTVLGYQVYGNGAVSSQDLGNNNNTAFNVTWGDDANSVSLLTKILAELYTMVDNDETIIGQLNDLLGHAQTAEELLTDIEYWVNASYHTLWSIKLRVEDIEDLLDQIVDAQGESTFEEPDTSGLNDYNNAEGELVSGADDTSDIEDQLNNFEIDANASGSIWGIIQNFLDSNPKVFGLFIGMLCLGIVALILNR